MSYVLGSPAKFTKPCLRCRAYHMNTQNTYELIILTNYYIQRVAQQTTELQLLRIYHAHSTHSMCKVHRGVCSNKRTLPNQTHSTRIIS